MCVSASLLACTHTIGELCSAMGIEGTREKDPSYISDEGRAASAFL